VPGASKPLADAALHPTLLKRWEPQHRLGAGGYGVVVSVCDKASGEMLVVKKISDAFICAADAQRCFREVAFQKAANHPNLLPLLAVSVSATDLYLLCPPMAMDLQGALRHNLLPHARQKRCVLYQLSCALAYMHASGALHRDLKPANVLLDLDGHLRLCDFGLCRSTPTPDEAALATPRAPLDASNAAEVDGSQSLSVGSRWYRAPEVLLGASVYGASADMWSFGCIVAEVLSGKTLLLGSSSLGQLAKILEVTGGRPEAAELAADLNLPEERARGARGAADHPCPDAPEQALASCACGGHRSGELVASAPPDGEGVLRRCDLPFVSRALHHRRRGASARVRGCVSGHGRSFHRAARRPPPVCSSHIPRVFRAAPRRDTRGVP
jgi:serine/threonine protein kinase